MDALGLVDLRAGAASSEGGNAAPEDQRNTERAITILCTSVERRVPGALPFRLVVPVPHAGRGESEGSQARWSLR